VGCLFPERRGDQADLTCNECGVVVVTVAPSDVDPTMLRMAGAGGFFSEVCPHCEYLNTSPMFLSMEAYTCRNGGEGVIVRAQRSLIRFVL